MYYFLTVKTKCFAGKEQWQCYTFLTPFLGDCGLYDLSPARFGGINKVQQDHHVTSTDQTLGNGWPQSCIEILLLCHLIMSAGPVLGMKEVAAAQGKDTAVGSRRGACLACAQALPDRCDPCGAVAGPSSHHSLGHPAVGNSAGALYPTALHPTFLSFIMVRAACP